MPRLTKNRRVVTISLPKHMADEVDRYARENDWLKSMVHQEALRLWFKVNGSSVKGGSSKEVFENEASFANHK